MLFACIPIIYESIHYTFLFGGYDSGLPTAIFNVGMLKVLSRSQGLYRDAKNGAVAHGPAKAELERNFPRQEFAPVGAGMVSRRFRHS